SAASTAACTRGRVASEVASGLALDANCWSQSLMRVEMAIATSSTMEASRAVASAALRILISRIQSSAWMAKTLAAVPTVLNVVVRAGAAVPTVLRSCETLELADCVTDMMRLLIRGRRRIAPLRPKGGYPPDTVGATPRGVFLKVSPCQG